MKIKFAKISCIDDYIYVLEKNSRSATNFRKKKNEKNSYGVDTPWFSKFFKEIYFPARLKNMVIYIRFSKDFNEKKIIETTLPINSCDVKKTLFLLPIDNANLPIFLCLFA